MGIEESSKPIDKKKGKNKWSSDGAILGRSKGSIVV